MTDRAARWRIAVWAGLALCAALFLYLVRDILLPFVLAIIITSILDPLSKRLIRRGWKPAWAHLASIVSFFGSILLVLVLLTPVVTNQVSGLKDRTDQLVAAVSQGAPSDNFFVRGNLAVRQKAAQMKDPIDEALAAYSPTLERANLPTTKRALIAQYIEPQREQFGKILQNGVKSAVGVATGLLGKLAMLLFVPLLVWTMLPNVDDLKRRIMNVVPPTLRGHTEDLAEDVGEVFSSYLRGVSLAVLGYMAFMSVLLTLLGAPYGLLLGALFGALYLVPYLNVIISGTTLFLVTVASGKQDWLGVHFSAPWVYAAVLLAVYVVCHLIFDMIVYPRFVGQAVGLHPLAAMFVIFSGGALFGVAGMILAFPVAGAIKIVLDRLITVTNRVDTNLNLPVVPDRHRTLATDGEPGPSLVS